MNTQRSKANHNYNVTANWRHSKQNNPSFVHLLKLLLQPEADKIRERNGDVDDNTVR